MVEVRFLTDSISFDDTATEWAKNNGLLDGNGDVSNSFPIIIGMPDGSTDLGAFNLGLIQDSRTIKQALQDVETLLSGRLVSTNNLSDVNNKSIARQNLELGSASTYNVGTTGGVIPLLNFVNNWASQQIFLSGLKTIDELSINSDSNVYTSLFFKKNNLSRWRLAKSSDSEAGSNVGSDLKIDRYDDAGNLLGTVLTINRNTGILNLTTPLPITSGGTGGNTQASAKASLGLGEVNNTSDANKPISTATQTALDLKVNKSVSVTAGDGLTGGGVLTGTVTLRMATPGTISSSSTNSVTVAGHTHSLIVTKGDVGLSSVDNTSDLNKPISNATQTALNDRVSKSGSIMTGPLTVPTLRIPSVNDASASSTNHPFQIGNDNDLNLRIDNNEIMGLNNGVPSPVNMTSGIVLGEAGTTVTFGSTARQMINLYGTTYGIGVQTNTVYMRTNVRFSFFYRGVHSDATADPGTGGTLLLDFSPYEFKYLTYDIFHSGNLTNLSQLNNNVGFVTSSSNIASASKLFTARNITIGNRTTSFDGTAGISYTLDQIGALYVSSQSLGATGYVVFSNGFKVIWGTVSVAQDSYSTVTYPIAFSTTPAPVFPVIDQAGNNDAAENTMIAGFTSTYFRVYQAANVSGSLPYHVIGY